MPMYQGTSNQTRILLLALILGVLPLQRPGALEESFILDVATPGSFARLEGVDLVRGLQNLPELVLADLAYQPDEHTELLLHFDQDRETVGSPWYVPAPGRSYSSQDRVQRVGGRAALFQRTPLVLQSQRGALFHPGTVAGSFTIEFWSQLPSYGSNQSIISWKGSTWLGEALVPQSLEVGVQNRHMVWSFTNLFVDLESSPGGPQTRSLDFQLRNRRELLPQVWYHHTLRYDANRGLLEYLLDGKSEDVRYATPTGRSGGQRYQAWIGEKSPAQIKIGENFTGFVDELRVSRRWIDAPRTQLRDQSGWALFDPINFIHRGAGSKLLTIDAVTRQPGGSEVRLFWFMVPVVSQDSLVNLAPPMEVDRYDPRWKPVDPGRPLSGDTSGTWLMLKAEFLPDGNGMERPGLRSVRIAYNPDPPPPAPGGITLIPGNGSVTLRWDRVNTPDTQGYVLYYGTRPGQYFGTGALEGSSPIDVGNVDLEGSRTGRTMSFTLQGLENYRAYYFVIASYDQSNHPRLGMDIKRSLSREVSARPAP